MRNIPFFHSYDDSSKKLTLRGATHIPAALLECGDQIEILDAAQGALTELPPEFPVLKSLKVLFLSQNPFESVPPVLSDCPNLRIVGFKGCRISDIPEHSLPRSLEWLILTDNRIGRLPQSFRELIGLRKVALAGNLLSAVPPEIEGWRNLELLRLGANEIAAAPPPWLFELPKLAWYCDSGNPFSERFVPPISPRLIPRSAIEFGAQIGGSPTSDVFRGAFIENGAEVAVKLYKTRFTSDGYARDDIRASIAAGSHPNIVQVLGQLEDEAEGLVLSLVPPDFRPLGLPPSLESCTRDRFAPGFSLSVGQVRTILRDIAAATAHLHDRGITHGDLYAHNILTDGSGRSILGDFGGASFFPPGTPERARLEVRAFGCLIDDLLGILEPEPDGSAASLRALQQRCDDSQPASRPTLEEIQQSI